MDVVDVNDKTDYEKKKEVRAKIWKWVYGKHLGLPNNQVMRVKKFKGLKDSIVDPKKSKKVKKALKAIFKSVYVEDAENLPSCLVGIADVIKKEKERIQPKKPRRKATKSKPKRHAADTAPKTQSAPEDTDILTLETSQPTGHAATNVPGRITEGALMLAAVLMDSEGIYEQFTRILNK